MFCSKICCEMQFTELDKSFYKVIMKKPNKRIMSFCWMKLDIFCKRIYFWRVVGPILQQLALDLFLTQRTFQENVKTPQCNNTFKLGFTIWIQWNLIKYCSVPLIEVCLEMYQMKTFVQGKTDKKQYSWEQVDRPTHKSRIYSKWIR